MKGKYDVYSSINIIKEKGNVESHSSPIKDKVNRVCCFCGKSIPEVNFSDDAHAVSEMVGNKSIFSHYECNECNHAFGEVFEDSLGKYMMPYKILTKTFGKSNKNIIKDKQKDGLSYSNYRFQVNKNVSALNETEVNGYLIEKKNNGIIDLENDIIKIPRQKYNPVNAYCAFLKMAYSIVPVNDFKEYIRSFISLRQFCENNKEICLMSDDDKELFICGLPCKGVLERKYGGNPLGGVNVYLLKKTDVSQLGFKMLFLLEMRNFSFLIPVMSDFEEGEFTVNVTSEETCVLEIIDFRKMEEYFISDLPEDRIEIPKQCYPEIEEILRINGLLKTKEKSD